jgi:hypothetical protein
VQRRGSNSRCLGRTARADNKGAAEQQQQQQQQQQRQKRGRDEQQPQQQHHQKKKSRRQRKQQQQQQTMDEQQHVPAGSNTAGVLRLHLLPPSEDDTPGWQLPEWRGLPQAEQAVQQLLQHAPSEMQQQLAEGAACLRELPLHEPPILRFCDAYLEAKEAGREGDVEGVETAVLRLLGGLGE